MKKLFLKEERIYEVADIGAYDPWYKEKKLFVGKKVRVVRIEAQISDKNGTQASMNGEVELIEGKGLCLYPGLLSFKSIWLKEKEIKK